MFRVKQKKTIHDFSITENCIDFHNFFRPEFFFNSPIFHDKGTLNIVVCTAFQEEKPLLYFLPLRTAKHTAVSTVDWNNLDQMCTKTIVNSTVMALFRDSYLRLQQR